MTFPATVSPSFFGCHARFRQYLFAKRCTAHIASERVRDEIRREILRIIQQQAETGTSLDLDPRFPVRIDEKDLSAGRLEFILGRLNGIRYVEEIQFQERLERWLVASYQKAGERFRWRRVPRRTDVSIRLIDTAIGFGVFANRDLKEGELVGEYAGLVARSDSVSERTYCYEYPPLKSGNEVIPLTIDARTMGNQTRFINHAIQEVITHAFEFFNGHWRVVFSLNCDVFEGQQLLMNYGTGYWDASVHPPAMLTP